jgi:hypothetical protein
MKKAITNKVTKENVSTLGALLRSNKGIKTLDILNNGRESFAGNKKEFCFRILELLESGKLLQISTLGNEGYFSMTNPNVANYIDSKTINEIVVSVYVEKKKPETLGEALNADGWTLD